MQIILSKKNNKLAQNNKTHKKKRITYMSTLHMLKNNKNDA